MIYQSLLRKHTVEKNKISNFQHQNSVERVKEMVLNQAILQIDVHIVEVTVELDQTKVSLLFNKHVLNAMEMVKKLQTLVLIVMVKARNKHLRKFQ